MTNYNDGKWHGWNGGECPVHYLSEVDVKFQSGVECEERLAGDWVWGEDSVPIIAFRVVKEHKEPRECWMDDDGDFWNTYSCAKGFCKGEPVKFREVLE